MTGHDTVNRHILNWLYKNMIRSSLCDSGNQKLDKMKKKVRIITLSVASTTHTGHSRAEDVVFMESVLFAM